MKNILFLLTFLFMLTCCSDAGSDSPNNPNLNLTPEENASITCSTTSLTMGYEGGEKTLSFTANKNWTISMASGITWCTISQTAGSAGTFNVFIKVSESHEYDDRNVTINIKCDNVTHNVVLTQKQKDALLTTTNKYEVDQKGGTIEVEVKANVDYHVQISESSSGWIKESSSRGLSSHKHLFIISANEEYDKREGEIYFKSGNKMESVKVYQTGGAILVLSKNEYTISDKGETIFVDLKSNTEYGVQMPDVDWITNETSSRSISSHTLKYIISANDTYDSRSAEIIYYDKNSDLKDTLKVVQVQKNAIIVSDKTINVEQKGGTIEVIVNSNVEFDVQIPSNITWVTQIYSRGLTENKVYFKIIENTNENDRNTEIEFINKELQVSETITLCQAGLKGNYVDGIVTVVKAGTIRELLGEDYLNITSLKVIGSINGTDVRVLREMAGSDVDGNNTNGQLQKLILSECDIEEGGETYIFSKNTTKNTVGVSMFQNCSSLKELYLPESTIKIEDFALANCTNLNVFDIPKHVISLGDKVFQNCSSLEKLVIPGNIKSFSRLGKTSINSVVIEKGVKSIPYQAFYECVDLKKIYIPETVSYIGSGAFDFPSDMKEVHVDNLEQWLSYDWDIVSIYGHNYPLTGDEGILYIGGKKINEVMIPNTFTSIPRYAFRGCTNIEAITLPNTLESIGEKAFAKTRIRKMEIPNSVKNIDEGAFSGCLNLESVMMSNMVTRIPKYCFEGCIKLKFKIPSNIQDFGYHAFLECESLEEITIPEGIVYLSSAVFEGCVNVKTITLPSTLVYIQTSTFGNVPASIVYCLATTPPDFSDSYLGYFSNFDAVNKNTAKLYVPKGSIEAYRASKWGKYFYNILEID